MATRQVSNPLDRLDRRIAVDLGVVVGLLVLLYPWGELVSSYFLGTGDSFPLGVHGTLLATQAVFVGGVALLAAGYVRVRDLDVGLERPTREHLPVVALAALAPAALVGLTKATAALTGVTLSDLASSYYAAEPPTAILVLFVVVGPIVAGVTFALVCQVLLQQTFARTLERPVAALLTTLVAGFLLVSSTGGLTMRPDRGHLLGAALFAIALGVAVVADERVADDRDWLRALAALPALVIVALAVLEGIVEIDTIAGGLYLAAHLVVLGVAAFGYERTDSLVVPALAYASLLASIEVVLLAFEVGV